VSEWQDYAAEPVAVAHSTYHPPTTTSKALVVCGLVGWKTIGCQERRGQFESDLKAGNKMSSEWVHLGTLGAGTEEVYGQYRHTPCGTVLEILQGHVAHICPKCHADEWAAQQRRDGFKVD
jgi:predicted RNA-binding Zn-ribbon protein involved in translation (DUF1610 family)